MDFEFTQTMPGLPEPLEPEALEEVETLGTVAGAAGDPGERAFAPAEPGGDWLSCPAGAATLGTVAGASGVAEFVDGAGCAAGADVSLEELAALGTVAGALEGDCAQLALATTAPAARRRNRLNMLLTVLCVDCQLMLGYA